MTSATLTNPAPETEAAASPERPTYWELAMRPFKVPKWSLRRVLWDLDLDWGFALLLAALLAVETTIVLVVTLTTGDLSLAIALMLLAFAPFAYIASGDMGQWLDEHILPNGIQPKWDIKPETKTVTRRTWRSGEELAAMAVADITATYGIEVAPEDFVCRIRDGREMRPVWGQDLKTGRPVLVDVHYPDMNGPAVVTIQDRPKPTTRFMGAAKKVLLGA